MKQSSLHNFSRKRPEFTIPESIESFAEGHAESRNELHREHDSSLAWGVNYEKTDEIGVLGEAAFADYYGLDMNTRLKRDGDEGIDFRISWRGESTTVDLKSTRYSDPKLMVRADKKHIAERFVLMTVSPPRGKIHGWIPSEVIMNQTVKSSQYGHENYELPNSELLKMPHRERIEPLS